MSDDDVCVTGVGLITALGAGAEANLQAALDGRSGLGPVTRFDASRYACRTAGEIRDESALDAAGRWVAERAGEGTDRPGRLLAAALGEALAGAGLAAGAPELADAPLAIGNTLGGMEAGTAFYRAWRAAGRPAAGAADGPDLSRFLAHAEIEPVARAAGLGGPLRVVSNACASGANAIRLAGAAVREGRAAVAIGGGFEPFCEFTHAGFSSLQALTRDAVRPLDRARSGMALGEGAGVLVLERRDRARARGARIRAVLAGAGECADPHHLTRTDPGGGGLAAAVRQALAAAGLPAGAIGGIVAHATATPANDPAEIAALRAALGPDLARMPVTALKPYWGHLLGAAGGAEAALAVLLLERGRLPPLLNLRDRDPSCDGPPAGTGAAIPLARPAVLVDALGFGGLNAALVFTF